MLKVIQRNSDLLLALVSDILDFSKIEANKMNIELIPCEFKDIFNSICESFAPRIKDKRA